MALDRTWYNTLVDDDGSGTTGTIIDKADMDAILDAVDAGAAILNASSNSFAGIVGISGALQLGGGFYLSSASPASLTAATHNYALPTTIIVNLGATGAVDLTGMVASAPNRFVILVNVTSFTITIKHENAGSTAANRFYMRAGTDIALLQDSVRPFIYNTANSRWRPLVDA